MTLSTFAHSPNNSVGTLLQSFHNPGKHRHERIEIANEGAGSQARHRLFPVFLSLKASVFSFLMTVHIARMYLTNNAALYWTKDLMYVVTRRRFCSNANEFLQDFSKAHSASCLEEVLRTDSGRRFDPGLCGGGCD